jgi:hypothetical protein
VTVSLERDLERRLVAAPDLVHEPLVAGKREQALRGWEPAPLRL